MKKAILRILVSFGIIVAGLLLFALTKPDVFEVERTVSVNAPREKIFALLDDLHSWQSWSPYEIRDPAMKRTFSGTNSGKGAVYEWDGNGNVGAGRMEITDTIQFSKVVLKLDFTRPFEGHNVVDFLIERHGDSASVTWAMHGPANYFARVISIFVSMDSMIGKDFEHGLINLKNLAEK